MKNRSESYHPYLLFGSRGQKTFLSTTYCTTETTYVDLQVTCVSRGAAGKANCGVDRMRKLVGPTEPTTQSVIESTRILRPNYTTAYTSRYENLLFETFMDALDENQHGSAQSSMIEWYMQDPFNAFAADTFDGGMTELGDMDVQVFERRLALLYNTLWKASWAFRSNFGGNMSQLLWMDTLLNTTSHTTFPLSPVYAINTAWMIMYFVSVAVMFCAAVFSIVVHHRCRAPPVLGYISSLTRDSVYFASSSFRGNSTEDGSDRTQRLGATKVILADTKGDGEVGKIAFVPVGAGRGVRVMTKRWYE